MEGSARKVITVRSALMVKNRLDVLMEVRLDSPSAPDSKMPLHVIFFHSIIKKVYYLFFHVFSHSLSCFVCVFMTSSFDADFPSALTEPVVLPPIPPGQALAIPLHLTSWRMQARPKDMGLFFCKVPIHWTSVERPGEISSSRRECQLADFDDSLKRNFR